MPLRTSLRRSFTVFILGLLALVIPQPASAQSGVTGVQVDYTFGEQVRFQALLEPAAEVSEAVILFDAQGVTHIRPASVEVFPNGQLQYAYTLSEDSPLRPFSEVRYRYRLTLESGEVITSPFHSFTYADNRFDWQTLDEGPLSIHWYNGNIEFAQNILDVSQAGLEKVESLLSGFQPTEPLDIYVYSNAAELQAVLMSAEQSGIAGHADPDLGVIVVAIPQGPDQAMLVQQRVPHELMHVMLYQQSRAGYRNLPVWLSEGLASTAELYPNPDYQVLIDNAYDQDSLLPIASLCSTFPREASGALLAYAEAASFTQHLYSTYGASGIEALVGGYTDGLGCEQGFESALGLRLVQAERQWRREAFDENASLAAFGNLLPWLGLLFAALLFPLLASLRFARKSRNSFSS